MLLAQAGSAVKQIGAVFLAIHLGCARQQSLQGRSGIAGFIPIFVLLFSALLMALCGLLIKKCRMAWLETYAMAISMIAAMVFAVVITPVLL